MAVINKYGIICNQHRLVKPDNLTNVKIASYSINQVISIVFLVTGLLDCLI